MKNIFMHIPKCGGSSIYKFLNDNGGCIDFAERYDPHWGELIKDLDNVNSVGGHIYFDKIKSIFKIFASYRLFTILRDPLEQLVSHLRWVDRYNYPEHARDYWELDIYSKKVVDMLGVTDFMDPGSIDYFIGNMPPQAISYFDNVQSRYFIAGSPALPKDWMPITLNMADSILIEINNFTFVGHMKRPEKTMNAIRDHLNLIIYDSEMPKINENYTSRSIDLNNSIIVDILKKLIIVDEWLSREIIFRLDASLY